MTSSATLWTLATFLVLWAAKRRRAKSERIRRLWELEEAMAAPEMFLPPGSRPGDLGELDDLGRPRGAPPPPPPSKTWIN